MNKIVLIILTIIFLIIIIGGPFLYYYLAVYKQPDTYVYPSLPAGEELQSVSPSPEQAPIVPEETNSIITSPTPAEESALIASQPTISTFENISYDTMDGVESFDGVW